MGGWLSARLGQVHWDGSLGWQRIRSCLSLKLGRLLVMGGGPWLVSYVQSDVISKTRGEHDEPKVFSLTLGFCSLTPGPGLTKGGHPSIK